MREQTEPNKPMSSPLRPLREKSAAALGAQREGESMTSSSRLTSILSFTQGLIPLLVAIFLLWYFGTTLKRMFSLTSPTTVNEIEWGRNVYLYSGLEALAYAAAGFLFGREVNRQRADRAEEDAARSQQVTNEAQSTAATSKANGQALAAGLRSLGSTGTFHSEAAGPEAVAVAVESRLDALRQMADELFPPERAA